MCGIITVTDLVEQLVGDFDDDETERQEPELERLIRKRGRSAAPVPSTMCQRLWITNFPMRRITKLSAAFSSASWARFQGRQPPELEIEGYLIRILNVRQHCVEKAIVRLEHSPANPL